VTKSLDTVIQKDLRIKKVTGVCLKKGFCRIRHLRCPLPAKSRNSLQDGNRTGIVFIGCHRNYSYVFQV